MPGTRCGRAARPRPGDGRALQQPRLGVVVRAEPAGERTRLISRNLFDLSAVPVKDKLAYPVIEPGSWVMEYKMPLTIKQRAGCPARTQATI